MSTPNFFIIGAPKCGTTSMATWLATHPNVFMSPIKEPHYFNLDSTHRDATTARQYQRLFRGAGPEHVAVGEASVYYLYSTVAVATIERTIDQPRYIVMLRNPIEMAQALHGQKVLSGSEQIRDFNAAWRAQGERRQGRLVTRYCRDPALLVYGDVCMLGAQLRRLFDAVPNARVLTLLLEDMAADPAGAYRRTLEFLGVADDGRDGFAVENSAAARRSPALQRVMRILIAARRKTGIPHLGTGLMPRLDHLNRIPRPPTEIAPDLRAELAATFEADILLLSELLGRNLSHWLDGASQ